MFGLAGGPVESCLAGLVGLVGLMGLVGQVE